jgi:hypothetical protein
MPTMTLTAKKAIPMTMAAVAGPFLYPAFFDWFRAMSPRMKPMMLKKIATTTATIPRVLPGKPVPTGTGGDASVVRARAGIGVEVVIRVCVWIGVGVVIRVCAWMGVGLAVRAGVGAIGSDMVILLKDFVGRLRHDDCGTTPRA